MESASTPEPAEGPAGSGDVPGPGSSTIVAWWSLARGFFGGERRWTRRAVVGGLLLLVCGQTWVQAQINFWHVDFFNALERKDASEFWRQSVIYLGWVAASIAVATLQLHMRMNLQVSWRQWITRDLIGYWVDAGRHYQLKFMDGEHDNPDQRIADDVRLASENAVNFAEGIAENLLLLLTFIGILWSISGTLSFTVAGISADIPGYMVWLALLYAGIGSLMVFWLGLPLVRINMNRWAREGDFRFRLVRVREESEAIALSRGERDERAGLDSGFDRVVAIWRQMIARLRDMTALSTGYTLLASFVPVLVAAPQYFSGAIALGGLMQVVGAFAQVQRALSWFVDNFSRYTEWSACVQRVAGLRHALAALDRDRDTTQGEGIALIENDKASLQLRKLDIAYPDGSVVVSSADGEIRPGERVLVTGESGVGKSTLMRAIAGLWPWGQGSIALPPDSRFMFLPQRPYIPLGTLRAALAYPSPPDAFDDEMLRSVLARVELANLTDRLDEEARWDHILSGGEQQKLAFARLLLQRPSWIVMDEATAALDEENQAMLMALLRTELPEAAVISIGHRPGLEDYHDRTLMLVRGAEGARLVRKRSSTARPAAPSATERRLLNLFGGRRRRSRA